MRCVIISGSRWKCKKHNVRSKHFNAEHEAFRYWRIVLSEICQLSIRKEITNTVSVTWIAELNKHRNIHSDKKAQQCLQSRVCKKKRDYNSGKDAKCVQSRIRKEKYQSVYIYHQESARQRPRVRTSTIKNLQGKLAKFIQSRVRNTGQEALQVTLACSGSRWECEKHIVKSEGAIRSKIMTVHVPPQASYGPPPDIPRTFSRYFQQTSCGPLCTNKKKEINAVSILESHKTNHQSQCHTHRQMSIIVPPFIHHTIDWKILKHRHCFSHTIWCCAIAVYCPLCAFSISSCSLPSSIDLFVSAVVSLQNCLYDQDCTVSSCFSLGISM